MNYQTINDHPEDQQANSWTITTSKGLAVLLSLVGIVLVASCVASKAGVTTPYAFSTSMLRKEDASLVPAVAGENKPVNFRGN